LKDASKIAGCEVDIQPFTFGGGSTDAAAFQQGGIPSGGILGIPKPMPKWYHTRNDNWDNLDPGCIKIGLKIGLEAVRLFDKDGKKCLRI
jgi:hypothetical protein